MNSKKKKIIPIISINAYVDNTRFDYKVFLFHGCKKRCEEKRDPFPDEI